MVDQRERILRRAYRAFNDRDIDGALALMRSDVDWPNALEGGRVRGHEAVREYWAGQFATLDPRVEPLAFGEDEAGRVVVDVHQVVRDAAGEILVDQRVQHAYAFREGLVERMDVIGAQAAR